MAAVGAFIRNINVLRQDAELNEPPRVCCAQVDHRLAAGAAVEQAVRVPGEVALYRLRDIVVRLKAAAAYRGAYRGVDALRFRAERRHSVKRVPEDVPDGAAPAAVDRPGGGVLPVIEQHGHAVGHHAHYRQAALRSDDAVGLIGYMRHAHVLIRRGDDAHIGLVYLLRHGHIVDADAHKPTHAAVVFAHGLGIVAPVGAEVQRGKYPRAHAAIARGKRVARADLIRAHIDEPVMVILCKGHGSLLLQAHIKASP